MKLRPISIISIALVLGLIGCSRQPEKAATASSRAVKKGDTPAAVLATIPDEDKPVPVIPGHGGDPESPNQAASFQVTFSESGNGVVYVTEREGKVSVVYNGTRQKEYSAVGTIVLSSDGQRLAYAAETKDKWRMVVDGREGRPYDTLLTPIFSPDSKHVAYQAKEGAKWFVVIDGRANGGTMASYTTPEFNADSTLIAYVEFAASNSEMRLIVSDLRFHKENIKKSIGDLLFTTNKARTRIAAAQVVGDKVRIIDFGFAEPDVVREGPLYDLIEQLTLSDDGESVTYCALRGRNRLIVLDGREEPFPPGQLRDLPVVRPDGKGVGVLLISQDRFRLYQAFGDDKEQGKPYDAAESLTYSRDGSYAYAARKGQDWFVVVNGREGPAFDRVVSPVFSPDGGRVVYRAKKDESRFVVVADRDGKTIQRHPAYEQVFQPVVTPDGKAVAYGVKDGNNLVWKVEKLGP